MKSLKLKKVKISRIGNPHILFGGLEIPAQDLQNAQQNMDYPITYTLDTKQDGDCPTQTNGTTTTLGNATDFAYARSRGTGIDFSN